VRTGVPAEAFSDRLAVDFWLFSGEQRAVRSRNVRCMIVRSEMASGVDSVVESDGAEPQVEALARAASPEVVDAESQQLEEDGVVRRMVGEDGSELVVLTSAVYDEMASWRRRPRVADWLYDQLNDEQRRRLDIAEKYRVCSEALAREHQLVARCRQLLVKHQIQLQPTSDIPYE